jgi:cobalamin synthase
VALVTALVTALFTAGLRGLLAFFAVALYSACVGLCARRRLGGVTGDLLGFVCETGEAVALLVLAAGLV